MKRKTSNVWEKKKTNSETGILHQPPKTNKKKKYRIWDEGRPVWISYLQTLAADSMNPKKPTSKPLKFFKGALTLGHLYRAQDWLTKHLDGLTNMTAQCVLQCTWNTKNLHCISVFFTDISSTHFATHNMGPEPLYHLHHLLVLSTSSDQVITGSQLSLPERSCPSPWWLEGNGGCRGKLKVGMKNRKFKLFIPSVIVGNVRCLPNKTDELEALTWRQRLQGV